MGEAPASGWTVDPDWEARAARIGARQRYRDDAVRAVAVVGDYARNRAWAGSLLRVVLFRNVEGVLVDEGAVREEDGVGWAVDRIAMGVLAGDADDSDQLLSHEPLAGDLADARVLRMTDAGLGQVLGEFRDRYYSAEGRDLRARRALQEARVLLGDYGAQGRPIDAVNAVREGIAAAVGARMGEPVDLQRLGRHLRGAGRILRTPQLAAMVSEGLGLAGRDADDVWSAVDSLHSLAKSHLDARLPEVGAALQPRLERALIVGRRASAALTQTGDPGGVVWAAINAAAEVDGIIEAASPGWRERDDYGIRAAAVYGAPDAERLSDARREVSRSLS